VVPAQTASAKPIDPNEKHKREQKRQEDIAKMDAVLRGEISWCEAFKSDLQNLLGNREPCLSEDPTYRAVRDGVRDALRR
jgi:hypothetical protein